MAIGTLTTTGISPDVNAVLGSTVKISLEAKRFSANGFSPIPSTTTKNWFYVDSTVPEGSNAEYIFSDITGIWYNGNQLYTGYFSITFTPDVVGAYSITLKDDSGTLEPILINVHDNMPVFPLNVQAGSPQYTLTSQVSPTSTTTTISVTNADSIEPISNAYYTIQNTDGSKWCTFYIGQWTTDSTNNYTGISNYFSSNTSDVFPEGSTCWCIWCKEYYDSLITKIGSGVDWSEITGKPESYPPSLHAATHASGGSDPITPASIGAAPADHTHSGAVQNITAVYSSAGGSKQFSIEQGGVILPMIPGVTYSGELRCVANPDNKITLQFFTAGFVLISSAAVGDSTTTVSIPNGTCCVMSTASVGNRLNIYPHTVTYQ